MAGLAKALSAQQQRERVYGKVVCDRLRGAAWGVYTPSILTYGILHGFGQPDRTLGPLFGARSAIPATGLSPASEDADLLDGRRAR